MCSLAGYLLSLGTPPPPAGLRACLPDTAAAGRAVRQRRGRARPWWRRPPTAGVGEVRASAVRARRQPDALRGSCP